MKITTSYLRKVIKEELSRLDERLIIGSGVILDEPDRVELESSIESLYPNEDVKVSMSGTGYIELRTSKQVINTKAEDGKGLIRYVNHQLKLKGGGQSSTTQSTNQQQTGTNWEEKLKKDDVLRKAYGDLINAYCNAIWSPFGGIMLSFTKSPKFNPPILNKIKQYTNEEGKKFFERGNPKTLGFSTRVTGNYDSYYKDFENVVKKIREGIVAIKTAFMDSNDREMIDGYNLKFKPVTDAYNNFIPLMKK